MPLHLLKLCVGIDSVGHLRERQAARIAEAEERGVAPELRHWTRHAPRRAGEILDGGSLYWVIRGVIAARQQVLSIERRESPDGNKRCAFVLDPALVETLPVPCRAFQGWRYLEANDAPPDRGEDEMPQEMARELRALGLI